jgi:hypothetical protein
MPIKLLKTDIATLRAQSDFRDRVIAILGEVGLVPPKPGPSRGHAYEASQSRVTDHYRQEISLHKKQLPGAVFVPRQRTVVVLS